MIFKTKDEEVQFTLDWWNRTIKDQDKLVAWLQKLYTTEIGGFDDYEVFKVQFALQPGDRITRIFDNIGRDELNHGGLIKDLLESWGYGLAEVPKSQYWSEMNTHIVDLATAAGVNYFGEAAAAFRFEVIQDCKNTPTDIRNMLDVILPDEQFHRETLMRVAGSDVILQLKEHHEATMKRLLGQ